MKSINRSAILAIVTIVTTIFHVGCSSLFDATRDKSVAVNQNGYMFRMSSGADTSAVLPGVVIGKVNSTYISTPSAMDAAYVLETKDKAWFSGTVAGGSRIIILTGSGVGQMSNVPQFELDMTGSNTVATGTASTAGK